MPCSIDRVLNAFHAGAFAGENLHSPVRFKHPVELIFDCNVGHVLAIGEGPKFLHRKTFKLRLDDEFFGHRSLPKLISPRPSSPLSHSVAFDFSGSATTTVSINLHFAHSKVRFSRLPAAQGNARQRHPCPATRGRPSARSAFMHGSAKLTITDAKNGGADIQKEVNSHPGRRLSEGGLRDSN